MPILRQTSFNGGQLDALLRGRADMAKYPVSSRACRNFVPTVQGPLVNRCGTVDLGALERVQTDPTSAQLIPFVFSNDQSYVLEVAAVGLFLTARIWFKGALVVDTRQALEWDASASYAEGAVVSMAATSSKWLCVSVVDATHGGVGESPEESPVYWLQIGGPFEFRIPMLVGSLSSIRYAQCGDVLTMVSALGTPIEVRRYGHADWRCELIDFAGTPADFFGAEPKAIATGSGTTIPLGDPDIGFMWAPDETHPSKPITWVITAVCRDERGRTWESAPYTVRHVARYGYPLWTSSHRYSVGDMVSLDNSSDSAPYWEALQDNVDILPGGSVDAGNLIWLHHLATTPPHITDTDIPTNLVLYPDKPITISWTEDVVLRPDPGYDVLAWRIYRGHAGTYGLVEELEPDFYNGATFIDVGSEPDYLTAPPMGRDPFEIPILGAQVIQFPTVVTYHEERRVFANLRHFLHPTVDRPGWVLASRVGDYGNFDKHLVSVDSDSIEVELASQRYEEILGLVSIGKLLLCGSTAPWTLSGAGGGPLTVSSIEAHPQGNRGASFVDPVPVGDGAAVYIQASGPRVVEVGFSQEAGSLKSRDISALCHDLFTGYAIKKMALQRAPQAVLWVLRSDGKLLSLTFDHAEEVVAWAWHDQSVGTWEDICAIPEGAADVLYLLSKRSVSGVDTYRIERMAAAQAVSVPYSVSSWNPAPAVATSDPVHLDGAVAYDGVPTELLTGLEHLEGLDVYVLGDGTKVSGPFTVTDGQVILGAWTHVGSGTGTLLFSGVPPPALRAVVIGSVTPATQAMDTAVEASTATMVLSGDLSKVTSAPFEIMAGNDDPEGTEPTLNLFPLPVGGDPAMALAGLARGVPFDIGLVDARWSGLYVTVSVLGDFRTDAEYILGAVTPATGVRLRLYSGTSVIVGSIELDPGVESDLGVWVSTLIGVKLTASALGTWVISDSYSYASNPVTRAIVGMAITQDWEALDAATNQAETRHNQKNITRAIIEVSALPTIVVGVGETPANLSNASPDDEGRIEVRIKETWNRGGRVGLRSISPLPLAILSVAREVVLGGD